MLYVPLFTYSRDKSFVGSDGAAYALALKAQMLSRRERQYIV